MLSARAVRPSRQPLLQSLRVLRSAQSFHRTSISPRRGATPKGFFFHRHLPRPPGNKMASGLFYRSYSNGSGSNPFQAYASARGIVRGFIGLNAAVFGAWLYSSAYDRNFVATLQRNFMISIKNIKDGRYHTLLTSAISQSNGIHFLFNMVTFNAFGGLLAFTGISGMSIASLIVGSACVSSAAQLYLWASDRSPMRDYYSGLGASGVVMGMSAVATCLIPRAPMMLFFVPVAIPLWAVTALYVGVDTFYLHAPGSHVGHAAHLGGFAFGIASYLVYFRRFGGVIHMIRRRRF